MHYCQCRGFHSSNFLVQESGWAMLKTNYQQALSAFHKLSHKLPTPKMILTSTKGICMSTPKYSTESIGWKKCFLRYKLLEVAAVVGKCLLHHFTAVLSSASSQSLLFNLTLQRKRECDCFSINASQDESLGGRTISTEEQSWHRKPLVQPGHELKIGSVWILENIYIHRGYLGGKKSILHPHEVVNFYTAVN